MTVVSIGSVGAFLEWFYYLFLPVVMFLGALCFCKSVIRSTKIYDGKERLDGRTVIITGGSNGLGRAIAVELCLRGAKVISACRTRLRRESTAVYLREKTGSFNHRLMYMDLNNLESIRTFAQEVLDTEDRVDGLINNAGIICDRDFTADGIDRMMGVNFVGHFLLTNLLREKIMTTPNGLGRIISITGGSFTKGSLNDLRDLEAKQKSGYDLRAMYRSSKLGLYLMNREIARRFNYHDVCSLCVDPGLMNTDIYKNLPPLQNQLWSLIAKCMFRTPDEGMQSVLYALLKQDIQASSGMVVKDCEVYAPTNLNWTDAVIEDIWNQTVDLLQAKGIDLELGASEEVNLDDSSEQIHNFKLDSERLPRLHRRSITDDEETTSRRLPRPATPPRSNKTVHDEGDEMVEMVEFRAEEPAEVIRATPTRQNSVEQDKMLSRQKSDVEILREILHEEQEACAGSLCVNADVQREPTPTLESLADKNIPDIDTLKRILDDEASFILVKDKRLDKATDAAGPQRASQYPSGSSRRSGKSTEKSSASGSLETNRNIVEDLASDIERIQEMLQEEESADLERIEAMLCDETTPAYDDISPTEEKDVGGEDPHSKTDILRVREMLQAEKGAGRFSEESSHEPAYEGAASDKAGDLQALTSASDQKGVDSNSPVTSESQGVQVLMPNLERLTEASSVLRERNDSIKDLSFEYNYDRRNSQMHNSLTDVKTRSLLLYPAKKRISLS
ncbi:uncharacterized protein LOC111247309 isoform X2 [Varroa destructor]|uniref:Uncharacterized protein n=1 Tax=Varroa destructor TaxID=109461 RepID=A0A7M7JM32_VARDE|nr:uncharacterized protein LOC111247309 isoform X2 [Varroa destructor]